MSATFIEESEAYRQASEFCDRYSISSGRKRVAIAVLILRTFSNGYEQACDDVKERVEQAFKKPGGVEVSKSMDKSMGKSTTPR